jgi:hypothetical protein
MEQALETGAVYSAPFPITPEDGANAVGQRYFGPDVLVTDARWYSATEIFSAGFRTTRSDRCWASTTTPAPVGRTCGPTGSRHGIHRVNP